jgi:anti-sigma-K factor RskA
VIGEPRRLALFRAALPAIVTAAAAITGTVWSLWFTAQPRRYVVVEQEADTTQVALMAVCEGSRVRYFRAPLRLRVEPLP